MYSMYTVGLCQKSGDKSEEIIYFFFVPCICFITDWQDFGNLRISFEMNNVIEKSLSTYSLCKINEWQRFLILILSAQSQNTKFITQVDYTPVAFGFIESTVRNKAEVGAQ